MNDDDISVESRLQELGPSDSINVVQLLKQEDQEIEAKLGLDSGILDVHRTIKEHPGLEKRVGAILDKFYPRERSQSHTERYEEDIDDIYDVEEHREKSDVTKKDMGSAKDVVPPENFSHIVGEIYRSSFPRPENFPFLQNSIKLKSIMVLFPEEYPQENLDFMSKAGIKLFQIGMSGNKEPFVNIPSDLLTSALEVAINPENHPILIHCNRGKHRTGCLVGCIRRLQNWSLTMIFDEYRRFAFPKARALDQQFIEMYDEDKIKQIAKEKNWLPIKW
ncbi:LAME_0G12464g1_1 [Lachancea meyersii CBS 8951]|uniref:diphosphoinositol-polyphosphate diphosphatase n=1 Tax=Lachancea meyersii CBS 8951 TaxID=1266667 RepID=A0A1G4K9N4_9SACH|nr:LAME_0G12464g1_1 [Lachancea meyersii CBS 8951]